MKILSLFLAGGKNLYTSLVLLILEEYDILVVDHVMVEMSFDMFGEEPRVDRAAT